MKRTRTMRRGARERVPHLTQEQADQWMAANAGLLKAPACLLSQRPADGRTEIKGRGAGPAEVATCQVIGQTKWETKDGRDHTSSKVKWDRKQERWVTRPEQPTESRPTTVERGRLRFRDAGLLRTDEERYEEGRPRIQRGRQDLRRLGDYGQPSTPSREDRLFAWNERRQAEGEMAKYGRLKRTTVVLGQWVPRSMWFDTHRGSVDCRRAIGVVMHLADAYPKADCPEEVVADTRMLELIAMADLRELLRSYVTQKELEALEAKASGQPLKTRAGRYALERGRRKATAALCLA